MRKKHITWQLLSTAIISLLMVSAPALAGSLNPSAPPGPTMKTLDQAPAKDEVIPPWSQTLPVSERFKLVLGGAGVLDKETGLVWEQAPTNRTTFFVNQSWDWALYDCMSLEKGERRGWRLPTIQELSSLMVPGGTLPSGHPFSDVQSSLSSRYWSATADMRDAAMAFTIFFGGGYVFRDYKTSNNNIWCVRGGQGVDTQ